MGYDYPECFIGYNIGGYNDCLSDYGDDDVTICFECLFDEILNFDCTLRGRSAYYAIKNILRHAKCWMCKKQKKLLYENIPISKCYRDEYGITNPDENEQNSSEFTYKYSCMKCFENKDLRLVNEYEPEYIETKQNDCDLCERKLVACVSVL